MQRPTLTETSPFFHGYLSLVPDGDLLAILQDEGQKALAILRSLSEAQADHRYAAGKWSVKQLVGHLIDTERILVYRALCFARGERQSLPGFDEDAYVAHGHFERRTIASLAEELGLVRASTIAFVRGLDGAVHANQGTANGASMTVRALCWVVAGHERHHRKVLRERYGIG
jgi:uncharacterized damage-inducible protein DinB